LRHNEFRLKKMKGAGSPWNYMMMLAKH